MIAGRPAAGGPLERAMPGAAPRPPADSPATPTTPRAAQLHWVWRPPPVPARIRRRAVAAAARLPGSPGLPRCVGLALLVHGLLVWWVGVAPSRGGSGAGADSAVRVELRLAPLDVAAGMPSLPVAEPERPGQRTSPADARPRHDASHVRSVPTVVGARGPARPAAPERLPEPRPDPSPATALPNSETPSERAMDGTEGHSFGAESLAPLPVRGTDAQPLPQDPLPLPSVPSLALPPPSLPDWRVWADARAKADAAAVPARPTPAASATSTAGASAPAGRPLAEPGPSGGLVPEPLLREGLGAAPPLARRATPHRALVDLPVPASAPEPVAIASPRDWLRVAPPTPVVTRPALPAEALETPVAPAAASPPVTVAPAVARAPATPAPTPAPTPPSTPANPSPSAPVALNPQAAPERGEARQAWPAPGRSMEPQGVPPPRDAALPAGSAAAQGPDGDAGRATGATAGPAAPAEGPGVGAAPPPARLQLDLPRGRPGPPGAGSSVINVLPWVPPPPEPRSKLGEAIEKSARPDCRTAHAGQGLLGAVSLLADAVKAADKGCRW